jgi:hypothetical protein
MTIDREGIGRSSARQASILSIKARGSRTVIAMLSSFGRPKLFDFLISFSLDIMMR